MWSSIGTWLAANWSRLVLTLAAVVVACFAGWAATKYVKSLAPCTPVPDAAAETADTTKSGAATSEPTPAKAGGSSAVAPAGEDVVNSRDDAQGAMLDQRRAGLDQGYNLRGLKRMNRAQLNELGDRAWAEYCKENKLPAAKASPKKAPPASKPAGKSA